MQCYNWRSYTWRRTKKDQQDQQVLFSCLGSRQWYVGLYLKGFVRLHPEKSSFQQISSAEIQNVVGRQLWRGRAPGAGSSCFRKEGSKPQARSWFVGLTSWINRENGGLNHPQRVTYQLPKGTTIFPMRDGYQFKFCCQGASWFLALAHSAEQYQSVGQAWGRSINR